MLYNSLLYREIMYLCKVEKKIFYIKTVDQDTHKDQNLMINLTVPTVKDKKKHKFYKFYNN
jgi:hypothetical protein